MAWRLTLDIWCKVRQGRTVDGADHARWRGIVDEQRDGGEASRKGKAFETHRGLNRNIEEPWRHMGLEVGDEGQDPTDRGNR